jgi:hypothetical protein
MTVFADLDERVSVLEDVVFNDLYPKVDVMNWGIGQVFQETQANRDEIAGLRVDVAALETSVRADITALKTGVTMQVNGLRREISTTRAALRAEMSAFKSSVDRRFDAVERLVTGRLDRIDAKLDECLGQVRGNPSRS